MFRALLFSTVLIASVAVGNEIQTADACGVKMGARRGPKVNRTAVSENPSRILIVGSRDGALVKKLKSKRHKTEYASSVSEAKHSNYDLVIADASQFDEANDTFKDAQVLKKKSDSRSTVATAETMLARTAVGKSRRATVVAARVDREPVATGTEGDDGRRAKEAGSEDGTARITTAPEARVAAEVGTEKTVEKVETAPKPKEIKTVEKPVREIEKPEKNTPEPAVKGGKWTRTFQFGTNQTSLNGAAKRRLKANAVWLQQNPDASLVIEGHTDSVGDEAYNVDLSERRANVAREFMIDFGIAASRISVEAKGETEPAFEPSTSGKNRRIVLIKN